MNIENQKINDEITKIETLTKALSCQKNIDDFIYENYPEFNFKGYEKKLESILKNNKKFSNDDNNRITMIFYHLEEISKYHNQLNPKKKWIIKIKNPQEKKNENVGKCVRGYQIV